MKVGVVGAGTMGTGIVQAFAQAGGYDVLLCSSGIESARRGYARIQTGLQKRVAKGKMTEEAMHEILGRITVGEYADCADCELVIEAVTEKLETKQKVFKALENVCSPDCIFASDTSALSITEIGANIRQVVVGMHFFNPAHVMKLVEVTPGLNTPVETVKIIEDIAKSLGKTPVNVKENAGFIVNRILIPMINEAIGLYADGVATVEDIDTAMKLGANHPMGPLALCDFIGLDICLAIMETLQQETGDSKYRPHPLLRKMVRGGWLGVKSKRGFYKYE